LKKETPHRQFNKISLCFSLSAKEKNRLEPPPCRRAAGN